MDGIMSNNANSGLVMVLAATNMPWDLDDVRYLSSFLLLLRPSPPFCVAFVISKPDPHHRNEDSLHAFVLTQALRRRLEKRIYIGLPNLVRKYFDCPAHHSLARSLAYS